MFSGRLPIDKIAEPINEIAEPVAGPNSRKPGWLRTYSGRWTPDHLLALSGCRRLSVSSSLVVAMSQFMATVNLVFPSFVQ
jgi:hypothetical protein